MSCYPNQGDGMREQPRPTKKLNLRKTLFVLPSLITLSSVFCGFDAIRVAAGATASEDYYRASILIIFAMFFDMLDGRVARMTKTQSAFGLQLDSLADVVSFGVAPAVLMYSWSLKQASTVGLVVAFLFVAAGAVRLARFNVLSMSAEGAPKACSKYFLGLPIPAAAGVVVALVIANHSAATLEAASYVWPMMGVTLLLSVLMISNVRFRTFKQVRLDLPTVLLFMFVIGSSIGVAAQFGTGFVLFWMGTVYISMGLIESVVGLPKRIRARSKSVPPP